MLKDTAREVEIDVVETPKLLQLLPALPPKKKPVAFARIRTLHGLLKVALDDFEAVLGDRKIVINMSDWVRPIRKGGRCSVCLAGSVMYRQYGIRSYANPADLELVYGDATGRRLEVLNDLRVGYVSRAWRVLHDYWTFPPNETLDLEGAWAPKLRGFTDRHMRASRAHVFLGEMRALQKDLKTAGL